VLAHSLGGIADPELSDLVAADRSAAVKLPVLDRLLSKSFQENEPAKTFLFQQMGTFNVAKMADLRNLSTGGPTVAEVVGSGLDVTFLAGANDAVLSAATVRRAHVLVKGSRLELVPDAPHSMYWERPDLFNAAIVRVREAIRA
jgi:pimeloyl-ACP methyl ester carboxylesterase